MNSDPLKNIYILRKDLRTHLKFVNNSFFYYFFDEENLSKENRGKEYKKFLSNALNNLKISIEKKGGKMKIIQGSIKDYSMTSFKNVSFEKIYIQRQYLPWEKEDEEYLKKAYSDKVVLLENNFLLTTPGEVLKDDGSPYVVFTPFYNKWQKIIFSKDTKDANKKEFMIIKEFFNKKINNYGESRDFPFIDGTSKFSKYINIGEFSPLDIFKKALDLKNIDLNWELFIRQLAWRDFYYHLYYYFPYVLERSFKEKYKNIFWDNDKELFISWSKGLTGYPFVDAGMRQLLAEGFMHNRLRMITASFLTKDLLIDWKKGENFFMEKLIDGDVILNNGGWQWSASTGSDAQPYFRIFNPVSQSKKFDSEGKYIKKYIPELKNVPTKYIHEPWKMSKEEQKAVGITIGKDYPYPIVNHQEQRIKALELYKI